MDPKELMRQAIGTTDYVCKAYVDDLTDEELLHRPVTGANHINWQLGHLIAAENMLANMVQPDSMPALPEGFAEKYTKETASGDDPGQFENKATLLEVQRQQREGLLSLLDRLDSDDLDRPSPESMRSFFPNVAALLMAADSHWMMHAGQWAIVRRSLGKPPLF